MLMEVFHHGPCPPKRQESQSAWCPERVMKWGSRCPKHESESGSLEDFLQWIWSSHCLVDIIKFEWTLIRSQQKASPTYSCENFWHKFFLKIQIIAFAETPPQHHHSTIPTFRGNMRVNRDWQETRCAGASWHSQAQWKIQRSETPQQRNIILLNLAEFMEVTWRIVLY